MRTIAESVKLLDEQIILLPYGERARADQLVHKWESLRRLSQLEQLEVDQILESIKEIKEKRNAIKA